MLAPRPYSESRGQRDRFVGVLHRPDRRDRPEHFLAHHGIDVGADVGQHGRRVEVAGADVEPAGRLRARRAPSAIARCTCSSTRARARSEIIGPRSVSGSMPVADPQRSRVLDEALDELRGDLRSTT